MVFLSEHLKNHHKDTQPFVIMGSEIPFPFEAKPSQIMMTSSQKICLFGCLFEDLFSSLLSRSARQCVLCVVTSRVTCGCIALVLLLASGVAFFFKQQRNNNIVYSEIPVIIDQQVHRRH